MCLTEYDEEKVMRMFREEAREDGLIEGEAIGLSKGLSQGREKLHRVNKLYSMLIDAQRYEDVKRAAGDPDYLQTLLEEFGLIEPCYQNAASQIAL